MFQDGDYASILADARTIVRQRTQVTHKPFVNGSLELDSSYLTNLLIVINIRKRRGIEATIRVGLRDSQCSITAS